MKSLAKLFREPKSGEKASIELEEAKCSLLESQSALEYAKAIVMYNTDRVLRLSSLTANGGQVFTDLAPTPIQASTHQQTSI